MPGDCKQRYFFFFLRFAAALLPRLFGTNPRSHHKGATGRVRTGNQLLPVLCHCQFGQDIPDKVNRIQKDIEALLLQLVSHHCRISDGFCSYKDTGDCQTDF